MNSSPVLQASWDQLGYRKINNGTIRGIDEIRHLTEIAANYGYKSITDSSGHWIRKRARKKGAAYAPPARVVAELDASNYKSVSYEFIGQYLQSKYHEIVVSEGFIGKSPRELEHLIQDLTSTSNEALAYERVSKAIYHCDPIHLRELLIELVLPIFFKVHTDGKVLVILHNSSYDSQYAYMRAFYTFSHYSKRELELSNVESFPTLKLWHFVDPAQFIRTNLEVANLAFFPYISGFQAGPVGLTFQFCFSIEVKHKPPIYPTDWLHKSRGEIRLGRQARDITDYIKDPLSDEGQGIVHQRFRSDWRPTTSDVVEFITWLVDASGKLLFEITDPCNFTDRAAIDGVWAYENLLTLDRILNQAITTLAADEPLTRKNNLFEVADLWETISITFKDTRATSEFFKILFDQQRAVQKLDRILSTVPGSIGIKLVETTREIYRELAEKSIDSVWLATKRTSQGVLVKNKSLANEREESNDVFTSNLVRALRNTHHGYLTKQDKQQRPSRYLVLTDGNLPDSITHLPILWWFAFIASPDDFVGWSPLGIGVYD